MRYANPQAKSADARRGYYSSEARTESTTMVFDSVREGSCYTDGILPFKVSF